MIPGPGINTIRQSSLAKVHLAFLPLLNHLLHLCSLDSSTSEPGSPGVRLTRTILTTHLRNFLHNNLIKPSNPVLDITLRNHSNVTTSSFRFLAFSLRHAITSNVSSIAKAKQRSPALAKIARSHVPKDARTRPRSAFWLGAVHAVCTVKI